MHSKSVHYYILLLMLCLILFGCSPNQPQKKEDNKPINFEKTTIAIDSILDTTSVSQIDTLKQQITVLVVPCSNGYEYNTKSFDLDPLIEKHLKAQKNIIVQDFPFKKMNGSGFHGVFDKKDCSKIIQATTADFLVLNRIIGTLYPIEKRPGSWGYETKIVATKNLSQEKSISAQNLENYSDIEKHIERNISKLVDLFLLMK